MDPGPAVGGSVLSDGGVEHHADEVARIGRVVHEPGREGVVDKPRLAPVGREGHR